MKDFKLKTDNSQESLNNSEWSIWQTLGGVILGSITIVIFIYGIQFLDILINN